MTGLGRGRGGGWGHRRPGSTPAERLAPPGESGFPVPAARVMASRQISRTCQAIDWLLRQCSPQVSVAKHHFCSQTTANGPRAAGPAPARRWLPPALHDQPLCVHLGPRAQTIHFSGLTALTPVLGAGGTEPTPAPLDLTAPPTAARGGNCANVGRRARSGVKASAGQGCGKGEP